MWFTVTVWTSHIIIFIGYNNYSQLQPSDWLNCSRIWSGTYEANATLLSSIVYHAVCLEQLSAQELLAKVASKLGLTPADISSFVRLAPTGILVLIDDTVRDFLLRQYV